VFTEDAIEKRPLEVVDLVVSREVVADWFVNLQSHHRSSYTYRNIVPSRFISEESTRFHHFGSSRLHVVLCESNEVVKQPAVPEGSLRLDWSVMAQSSHHRDAAFSLPIERLPHLKITACINVNKTFSP
jgi:hypothetical protein